MLDVYRQAWHRREYNAVLNTLFPQTQHRAQPAVVTVLHRPHANRRGVCVHPAWRATHTCRVSPKVNTIAFISCVSTKVHTTSPIWYESPNVNTTTSTWRVSREVNTTAFISDVSPKVKNTAVLWFMFHKVDVTTTWCLSTKVSN